ncbi:MAG: hypothetical protein IT252_15415 [Chitinophagaceae bacterium]|nr:hypothetical protein [Chitinophagaceae bacterium]
MLEKIDLIKSNENSPKKLMLKLLDLFESEIENYSKLDDFPDPWSSYTERPMLGFFASAISRFYHSNRITLLQDFNINSSEGSGRSDLYLAEDFNEFLIEAKFNSCSYGILDWKWNEVEKLNQKIFNQLSWYELREPSNKKRKRFHVSLTFHYIHNKTRDYFKEIYPSKSFKQETVDRLYNASDFFYKMIKPVEYTTVDVSKSVQNSGLEIWGSIMEIN